MKKTSRLFLAVLTILTTCCMTACDTTPVVNEKAIPSDNIKIAEAVKILDVSEESFNGFLDTLDMSYDEYMNQLKNAGQDLEAVKANIEETYNCTYKEYLDTVLAVNTKTMPDSQTYTLFKSEYSSENAYIPTDELNDDKNTLTAYDITIEVADTCPDAYAFDAIAACQGDFAAYMTTLNGLYGCLSAEFTNITIFGGYGINRPEIQNACMDYLFVYDDKTNEILKPITVAVVTLHNQDEAKNITLGLTEDLGLVFKTTGADSYDKMLKLSNLQFEIRNAKNSKNENTDSDK